MKKNILILSLLTLGLAGCSQEELIDNNANQKPAENKVFTATLEKEDAQSRIYVGNDNKLFWTAEDQISIFAGNTVNTVYQFDGKTGAASGTFTAVATTSATTGSSLSSNYAIYPYNEATTISAEGIITTTLPATQKYAVNSFGLGDNTMVAVTEGTEDYNLNFKNVCGYLKLQLYGTNVTVKTITLTGNNSEKLAGKATVTFGNDGPTVSMADDATTSITLDCGDNGVTIGDSENGATTFWMVVPPTTFTKGFTITVTTTDDVTFTQSTSNEIAISRYRVKPMKAFGKNLGKGTLSLPAGITFNNTIKEFIKTNENLTKIKFIANSSTTSSDILVTDEDDGTVAYMVANEEWLEIHTIGQKFIANEDSEYMFLNLDKLTTIEFGDNFDTSKTTSMRHLFVGCSSLTSLDVSMFNTSKVKEMSNMFGRCSSLTSLNLSNFDTSNVTTMYSMFGGCSNLTSLNVSTFNTSKVTDMFSMFKDCSKLTSLNVDNFDTSNVTEMGMMFSGCSSLASLNVSNFNTSNVTDMNRMFKDCSKLTSLNVDNFDTSNVTNMSSMFAKCSNLTSLNVSNFNTSNVTDMSWMFYYCSKLTSLNVDNFDTSKVTDMSYMFTSCSSLASLNVSKFNTSNVTDMQAMFAWCSSLSSLDLSKFNTSNVTNMNKMFYYCSKLTSLNVSSFDTSNVTNMVEMFYQCSNLTSLNVSSFNTSKVTDMALMFSGCSSLTSLDLTKFTFDSNPDVGSMLSFGNVQISVKVTETGREYLTNNNCNLPTDCKFVRPNGTDW